MRLCDPTARVRRPLITACAGLSLLAAGLQPGALAGTRRDVLPPGTVVPVKLDTTLSSKSSRPGERFRATVRYGRDDAGLPEGTRVEGVVKEALPSEDGKPGVLDLDFRRMVFPNGDSRTLEASLISLDNKAVRRSPSGRLIASTDKGKDRLKFVGIGAGAGLVIAALTKQNTIASVLLGAGAGYLYNELTNKKPGDVSLKAGTEFGVRMDRQLAFETDRPPYQAAYRPSQREDDRYYPPDSADREDRRPVQSADRPGDIGMLIDDREVRFEGPKPFLRGDVVMVPLEPLQRAGRLDYTYDSGNRVIRARHGSLRLGIGSRVAVLGRERRGMDAAAELRGGQVYVPMQFVALALDGSAYWDAPSRTVVITTRESDR